MNHLYNSLSRKTAPKNTIKHGLLFISFCVLSIAFVSCSSNSTGSDGGGPNYNGGNQNNGGGDEQQANEVFMSGSSFSPSNLEVTVGTEVVWTNMSSLVHTVTSGMPGSQDGMFDSGNISPDGTYSYTFTDAGTYEYFCIPHQPNMTGSITVVEN